MYEQRELFEPVELLRAAIRGECVVLFHYKRDEGFPRQRVFSPWEVASDEASVLGWDHDRGAIRRFIIDKIVDNPILELSEDYARPER